MTIQAMTFSGDISRRAERIQVKKMAAASRWGILLPGSAAEGQQGLLGMLVRSGGSELTWEE